MDDASCVGKVTFIREAPLGEAIPHSQHYGHLVARILQLIYPIIGRGRGSLFKTKPKTDLLVLFMMKTYSSMLIHNLPRKGGSFPRYVVYRFQLGYTL